MDRRRLGRIRSVMPVTWFFLTNDRACRSAVGLSLMVSMVTLERHNGVPTLERGNDQSLRKSPLQVVRSAHPTYKQPVTRVRG